MRRTRESDVMAGCLTAQEVRVPIPPSANHLWKISGQRMYLDPKYRRWLDQCAPLVCTRLRPVDGPIHLLVEIHGGRGFNRRRDLDNTLKAVQDMLRKAGILVDDSVKYVQRVEARYSEPLLKRAVAACWVRLLPWDAGLLRPGSKDW